MRRNIVIFFLGLSLSCHGQQSDKSFGIQNYSQIKALDSVHQNMMAYLPSYSRKFYEFHIPSVINGANIDPSPVSGFNANFTESKLTAKVGFPMLKKKINDLVNTFYLSVSAKAANGVATVWKTTGTPAEITYAGGYTRIVDHRYYTLTTSGDKTTEVVQWITLSGSWATNNYNLFDAAAPFDNIKSTITTNSYNVFVSFNRYFHSEIMPFKLMNVIVSVGGGYARTNNYSSLKKRNYEFGTTIPGPGGLYKSVNETVAGAIGDFRNYEGLTYYVEVFKAIVKSDYWGSIYWGGRLTHYGVGNKEYIINGVTGPYFSLKAGDKDQRKDALSFSVTAQYLQLNAFGEKDYLDDNFSIVVQTAVPIRIN
ncbi:MAG: hypothetical protein KF763_15235 [Cyclobacteriaceae bacterium]|nr:hypothetical protein [Cyclobacteriaceae bacterium]